MVEERFRVFLTEYLHTQDVRHRGRDFYTHLKGTYDLLRAWANPEPICLGGLFHSIYGTWHFRHKAFPIENRQAIRSLIGDEAEFLAYVFCVTKRPRAFIAHIGATNIVLLDHHTNKPLSLTSSELNNLLEIEAANLIEQEGNICAPLQQLYRADISASAKATIANYLAKASMPAVRPGHQDFVIGSRGNGI